MLKSRTCAMAVAASMAIRPGVGAASVFGSLGHFDVINDTGFTAHGFEIDLEGLHSSDITDTFEEGVGRGFPSGRGFDPLTCWSGGGVGNSAATPCGHFGVGTTANASKTTYSWLVETGTPGVLNNGVVNLPVSVWNVIPAPIAGNPPLVIAQIQAPVPANEASTVKPSGSRCSPRSLRIRSRWKNWWGAIRRSNRPSPRSSGNCCRQIRATRSNAAVNLAAAVPEPGTYVMLLAGLGLIGFAVHRRKRYMD